MPKRKPLKQHRSAQQTQSRRADSFEAVAKRLGADEDKARFEAKLGKIAKAKSVRKAK